MSRQQTILITGSTDGIGLETAKVLSSQGHKILLHGRNSDKLKAAQKRVAGQSGGGQTEAFLADLSRMDEVERLAREISSSHVKLDVLINNAGILRGSDTYTDEGLDVRFAVNTFAPYLLTRRLLPLLGPVARVVNLSSAAQSSVDLDALAGKKEITDQLKAYAQSKLALTQWTSYMANSMAGDSQVFVSVNPGSLLATKMVKEGFGVAGKDIHIGSDILIRAALSDEFAKASGKYFDNDSGQFAAPHRDALDAGKTEKVVEVIEAVLTHSGYSLS